MPITQLPPSGTDNNQLFSTRAQVWCCRQLVAILKIEKIGYWLKMIGKKVYLAAFFFFFFFFLDSPSSSSGGGASSTGGWGGFLLLLLLLCDKESENLLGLDHVVLINVELAKDVVNLSHGHLVSPGLKGVLEHLDVDESLDVVGLEGLDDQVVRVVAVSGHLLLEHVDHVLVGAGTADLSEKAVKLALSHEDTDIIESSTQVIFVNGAILVDVHELEAVLVHVPM